MPSRIKNKDLQLTIGRFKSNKIDCNYLKALLDSRDLHQAVSGYYAAVGERIHFSDSGYSSLEALFSMACYVTGSIWGGEPYDGGFMLLDAQTVEDSVREVFGITVDVTASSDYDAKTGKVRVLFQTGDPSPDSIAFVNGVWTYTATIVNEEGVSEQQVIIKLNEDLTVESIVVDDLGSIVVGDIDGDGELTERDGMLLARYLAGWDIRIPSLAALDIDGDGEISDWDSVVLERYLAGWDISIG